MFAMLAMIFLEFTCRLCSADDTGRASEEFSKELDLIDARYFTRIHGLHAPSEKEFVLPFMAKKQEHDTLVCALFDLIRNGLAHQYQQIAVTLKGKRSWAIELRGPAPDRTFGAIHQSKLSRERHLRHQRDANGDIWMVVDPGLMFLDFKDAFDRARLLKKGLRLSRLQRSYQKSWGKVYAFTSVQLEKDLAAGRVGSFRRPN